MSDIDFIWSCVEIFGTIASTKSTVVGCAFVGEDLYGVLVTESDVHDAPGYRIKFALFDRRICHPIYVDILCPKKHQSLIFAFTLK
jgi:hypothetical protein